MDKIAIDIPTTLIYEMEGDTPIYYKGYHAYLNNEKSIEELMGSSYLQSLIISKLVYILTHHLGIDFTVLTNEVGIKFKEKGWRAADIAVFDKKSLVGVPLDNKYINIPPQLVIEIDTKADFQELNDPFQYYHNKTEELLSFGVEKVIWIFTDSKKIMVAEPNKTWTIQGWDKPLYIIQDLSLTIEEIIL
ncbi:MAG: Uma2 family endonuclease [Bacteroidota bacterium]